MSNKCLLSVDERSSGTTFYGIIVYHSTYQNFNYLLIRSGNNS